MSHIARMQRPAYNRVFCLQVVVEHNVMSDTQCLYEGGFLRVNRRGHWEFVERVNARAAVVIIAVTDAGELLLVEQPRQPVDTRVIELPAGLVGDIEGEENEPMERAAARELEEETGYAPGQLTFAMAGPPSAGLANEHAVFYLARGLKKTGAGGGDHSEDIVPHAVALTEIHDWLARREAQGLLVDPKVYAGLYFAGRTGG